ncbi:serpin-type proteinase inhibitor 15 [Vairimorpha necatrix]|uniref:Serpin-type proteinase inhibitor 15 n=1 Tax=Vairimorpha necatrix TaxID=6039 RepID=A0AAX4JCK4_9MICR
MKIFNQELINLSLRMFNVTLSQDKGNTKNLAVSPYSFSQVLGLLANGTTDDETSNKFLAKMGFEPNISKFNENSMNFNENLSSNTKNNNEFFVKNFLLHRDEFTINEDFKTLSSNFYNTKISSYSPANMIKDLDNFNNLVANETKNVVKEAISDFSSNICLLIMNILYLKQEWLTKFNFCRVEDFTSFSGKVKQEMMHQYEVSKYNSYEDDKMIAILMRYKKSNLSFVAVMPKNIEDWDEVTAKICSKNELSYLISKMEYGNVNLTFPKFNYEYESNFSAYSKDLGIDSMLDSLKLNKLITYFKYENLRIKQKVIIDVNEFGTIAYAKTIALCTDGPGPRNVRVMQFNKPFLWFVINQDDNFTCSTPIFMGKYLGPKK